MANLTRIKKKNQKTTSPSHISGKTILITGGTGSFGKKCIEMLLRDHAPAKVIVFSRDELKQYEMQQAGFSHPNLRYFLGDIRDKDRLCRAMNGVDIVIHAAALKQVPSCEYNPIEAIMTNVMGTRNVIEASLDANVKQVIALSTDKAVSPANLYGATKLCAEKLIVHSNAYSGINGTRFACVRYGNVVGSRGSVIPVFLEQKASGTVTVTDARMSRFWITLDQGVNFVIQSLEVMVGGEVFVPKIPSMNVMDLVAAIAPESSVKIIGIRPGEKLHETLISEDEARHALERDNMYVIHSPSASHHDTQKIQGKRLTDNFSYSSHENDEWLTANNLLDLLGDCSLNTKKHTTLKQAS